MTHQVFFDQDGNPIPLLQWARLFEDTAGRTVASDDTPSGRLVTMWLGIVEPSIEGYRLFGTALVSARAGDERPDSRELETYDSKAQALAGHARHLATENDRAAQLAERAGRHVGPDTLQTADAKGQLDGRAGIET